MGRNEATSHWHVGSSLSSEVRCFLVNVWKSPYVCSFVQSTSERQLLSSPFRLVRSRKEGADVVVRNPKTSDWDQQCGERALALPNIATLSTSGGGKDVSTGSCLSLFCVLI